MAQTEKGIVYPYDYNEVADVPSDFKALAESIDALLNDYSLNTDSGNKIVLEMNNTTYKIKAVLKDKDDNVINTSNEIDLPLENMVTNISYNNQKLTLTHQDGQTTEVSIADLISDLASKEEVSELQSQVNDLENLVETELESNEVEGIELDVSDSAEYRGPVMPGGNLEQEQLSGKNLYGISDYEGTFKNVAIIIKDGKITLNGTANGTGTLYIEPKNEQILDGTYTISLNSLSGTVQGNSNINLRNANDNSLIDGTQLSLTSAYRTYTINNKSIMYGIYMATGAVFDNFKFRPQLVVGSTPDYDFEEYCGGQASPNPLYPQNIEVVTGDNVIKHCGKNLFDGSNVATTNTTNWNVSFINNVLSITHNNSYRPGFPILELGVLPSGVYKISGTLETQLGVYRDGTYSSMINSGSTFSADGIESIQIVWPVNEIPSGETKTYTNVQIEKGSTATPYEPYKEENFNLNLGNIELCKIGDYEDILFKNVIGDENYNAELEDGAWYKKGVIQKEIFDGSIDEGWQINSGAISDKTIYLTSDAIDNKLKENYMGISNYLINSRISLWSTEVQAMQLMTNVSRHIRLRVDKTTASNTDGFRTWLSTHNLELYYASAETTYTKITDSTLISQLEALRKAKWFKGVNHWWTETENLEPNLKGSYKQSNNLRLQALEQAVVALGGV